MKLFRTSSHICEYTRFNYEETINFSDLTIFKLLTDFVYQKALILTFHISFLTTK